MDVHVRGEVTEGLRRRGVDVLTAQEDGAGQLDDSVLLDRATELGRVLFSQDEDLLVEASNRQREGTDFATLVYGHQLNVSVSICIQDLELFAKAATEQEQRGRVVFLPLK